MKLRWVLFDLNGTLLDPNVIAEPIGGDERSQRLVNVAFRQALLLAMADTLSGASYRALTDYLRATLELELAASRFGADRLEAMMQRVTAMDPFPDAPRALQTIRDGGLHTAVLTNSTTEGAEHALQKAGLRRLLDAVIGTDAVERFKPHPSVYRHAIQQLGIESSEACLVAAHDWDVAGAMRAGLHGAWVSRSNPWLTDLLPEPDIKGSELTDTAALIVASSRTPDRTAA